MPSRAHSAAALACSAALFAAAGTRTPDAQAQVRRCALPDGRTIFTDRRCDEVGATERLPRAGASTIGARQTYRGGCARNLQDLMYEVTSAIDGRDANRLAGVYHWAGMSSDAAYRTLARLDAIAQRPLVDLVPVLPAEPETATLPRPEWTVSEVPPLPAPTAAAAGAASADPVSIDEPAPVRRARAPVALRVEQTLANGTTPSRTVFGLQRHLGCWWLTR
jgi:hypothetical protein